MHTIASPPIEQLTTTIVTKEDVKVEAAQRQIVNNGCQSSSAADKHKKKSKKLSQKQLKSNGNVSKAKMATIKSNESSTSAAFTSEIATEISTKNRNQTSKKATAATSATITTTMKTVDNKHKSNKIAIASERLNVCRATGMLLKQRGGLFVLILTCLSLIVAIIYKTNKKIDDEVLI